jgi:hypothetical protein
MHLGAQRLGAPTETRARSREYDLPTTQHSVHKTKLVGNISNLFTKLIFSLIGPAGIVENQQGAASIFFVQLDFQFVQQVESPPT